VASPSDSYRIHKFFNGDLVVIDFNESINFFLAGIAQSLGLFRVLMLLVRGSHPIPIPYQMKKVVEKRLGLSLLVSLLIRFVTDINIQHM
jgi:hypothetical protein